MHLIDEHPTRSPPRLCVAELVLLEPFSNLEILVINGAVRMFVVHHGDHFLILITGNFCLAASPVLQLS